MTDQDIRVVIADDHAFTRYGLRVLLESDPGITVVAEASDGHEAVEQTIKLRPDVVVMDVRMPNGSGLWATQEIQKARPGTKVLVHSEYEADPNVMAAMRAGASGFLMKAGDVTQIIRAVRDVAAGAWIFNLSDTARMRPWFDDLRTARREAAFPQLTSREREILNIIATPKQTTASAAARLGISTKRVENAVTDIKAKLGATDRAQLITMARTAGLGAVP
ncbi:Transcriptional regulatory protein DegU (plasmid) [Streptomyces sp. YIM 121038]|uniref:response regulator transcription factor n=1 Tax=Streptomyces sp. YIM 121038 TaxID=2136401 RepID=UPI0011108AED|nr:response regulator transcription factor [Streptomyces sp. YIM 121038]QCX73717.1 Transcriptional regulatory protein DegU [Streptomyces sp. YIM 121038]QCX82102.1 Transcriptional regulatory protein DegU [Streptomyces sp. YIM 121038]QCX82129.1 Transcriptional regulatory protein DegU [Streptomyces sp. YIM 121038]QCX82969.1 Transcriptional regulatory protein DegU [Streptomyces sp. YIM 121038]